MQVRTATIQVDADDTQPFGLWNGLYISFQDDGSVVPVKPEEVMEAFISAGVRVPDEFAEVREILQAKIAQLQAVF